MADDPKARAAIRPTLPVGTHKRRAGKRERLHDLRAELGEPISSRFLHGERDRSAGRWHKRKLAGFIAMDSDVEQWMHRLCGVERTAQLVFCEGEPAFDVRDSVHRR